MKKAIVISAYPGMGKSYATKELLKLYPWLKVLDSDSSFFSWNYDGEGNKLKERNPNFPKNYVDYIKSHIQDADIIFVSTHKEVRDFLALDGVEFTVVVPSLSVESMKVLRDGMESRGSSYPFVVEQMRLLKSRVAEIMTSHPDNCVQLDMSKGYLLYYVTKRVMEEIDEPLLS